jgi:hypothetical protein
MLTTIITPVTSRPVDLVTCVANPITIIRGWRAGPDFITLEVVVQLVCYQMTIIRS